MSDSRLHRIFVAVIAIASLISACGPSQPPESTISTAVAQTVQAQKQSASATLPAPTSVPLPNASATVTPASITEAETPLTQSTQASADLCTASAAFAGENYPDGTII